MDKIGSFLGGDKKTENKPQGEGSQQKEDYLDKGLDALEKKFGGGKMDPVKMRDTNEKITDAARGQFEKMSGRKVPEKFSN